MYRYETHLHTFPVSKCARCSVRESLECYRKMEFDGVFVTNHFLDGNVNIDRSLPYEEKLRFYFSDYEEALQIGAEMGLRVLLGVELSLRGTDFLIYGLSPQWYFDHPEIMEMSKTEELKRMAEDGALIIQAHPFREASYIDHIRLFPRVVHGVEVYNASRSDFENNLAKWYAQSYDLIEFAGSDNHSGGKKGLFGGMETETPLLDEMDFVERVKAKKASPFLFEFPKEE